MKEIESSISQFTEQLFPAFYREEGPNFIAFVKAYYEWMETSGQLIFHARNISDYRDLDRTLEEFIVHFKEKYLHNIQFTTASNKKLFIKNSLDFYRSKGTERAIDLFFKLIYGIEAKVYYPGDDIMRLSNNEWKIPKYIEVDHDPRNVLLVGKTVVGRISGAEAFIDNLVRKRAGTKYIDVFYIELIDGEFITGENIELDDNTVTNYSPRIKGSLTTVEIVNEGNLFEVGEDVYVNGARGRNGKVRVTEVRAVEGVVDFDLITGGFGYMLDADYMATFANDEIDDTKPQVLVSEVILTGNSYVIQDATTEYWRKDKPFTQFDSVQQNLYQFRVTLANTDLTLEVGNEIYGVDGVSNTFSSGAVLIVEEIAGTNTIIFTTSYNNSNNDIIPLTDTIYTANGDLIGTIDASLYRIKLEDSTGFANGDVITTFANSSAGNTTIIFNFTGNNTIYVAQDGFDLGGAGNTIYLASNSSVNTEIVLISLMANTEIGVDVSATGNVIGFGTTATIEYDANDANTVVAIQKGYVIYQQLDDKTPENNGDRIYAYAYVSNTNFDAINIVYSIEVANIVGCFRTDEPFYAMEASSFYPTDYIFRTDIVNTSQAYVIDRLKDFKIGIIDQVNTFYKDIEVYSNTSNTTFMCSKLSSGSDASFVISEISDTTTIIVDDNIIGDFGSVLIGNTSGWGFSSNTGYDLDSNVSISEVLSSNQITVGRISEIVQTNQGIGYDEDPIVTIYNKFSYEIEEHDYVLKLTDRTGGNFRVGEIVTGANSGAVGYITEFYSANNTMVVTKHDFDVHFINGEQINGDASIALANIQTVEYVSGTFLKKRNGRTGINAWVNGTAYSGDGLILGVKVINSGFGYKEDEELSLISTEDEDKTATGIAHLGNGSGIGEGYYKNREGFLSSDKYIHDNYFYQEYSYQVLTALPFDNYVGTLKKVLHVAGTEVFGKYVLAVTEEVTLGGDAEITEQ